MKFVLELTIPANTEKDSPIFQKITLAKGIISGIQIYFPYGCAGLAGVQVYYNETQYFPYSRGEWYRGNKQMISDIASLEISEQPLELKIKGYNLDDTYEHTPIVYIDLIRTKELTGINKFMELFS